MSPVFVVRREQREPIFVERVCAWMVVGEWIGHLLQERVLAECENCNVTSAGLSVFAEPRMYATIVLSLLCAVHASCGTAS
jgi:hypothetical protein